MQIESSRIRYYNNQEVSKISDEELLKLQQLYNNLNYRDYFFKINGHINHVKKMNLELLVNELIGQIISSYFNLSSVKSKVFKGDTNYYLVTDNFLKEGYKYTHISDNVFPRLFFVGFPGKLDLDQLSNLDLIRSINGNKIYKTNEKDLIELKHSLKGMIISDFIRNQKDRVVCNIMLRINENHVKVMPLYDFESSFLYSIMKYADPNVFDLDLSNKRTVKLLRKDYYFQELLYKAIYLKFSNVLDTLYNEYGICFNTKDYNDYNKIITDNQEIIKKYKLIK